MAQLRDQVFEIMESMLSCGSLEFETDRDPQQITNDLFEHNYFPANTSKIIVRELIKLWFHENKDVNFEDEDANYFEKP